MQIKEKILSSMRIRGPILPVHMSKEIGMSILFTSAFLSELLSDKTIKISSMKVGGSPVYFLPGQESFLERYSPHLKSKEKDAYILLKERGFLLDSKQEPAIRVALRSIKDFAVPFKKDDQIYWRYFKVPLSEFRPEEHVVPKIKEPEKMKINEKGVDIFDKPKREIKRTIKKKPSQKTNDKFFNKVKEYLMKQAIEISSIEGFSKTDLTLKIKDARGEKLLVAYDKKRITESDIIKAHKKAQEANLPFLILSLGETPKKLTSFIEAIRNLSSIEKI